MHAMAKQVIGWIVAHKEWLAAALTTLVIRVVYVFPGVRRWYATTRLGRAVSLVLLLLTDAGPDLGRMAQRIRATLAPSAPPTPVVVPSANEPSGK